MPRRVSAARARPVRRAIDTDTPFYYNDKLRGFQKGEKQVKQFFGMSQRGDLAAAVQGLYHPQFIMLLSNDAQFEAHVAEMEKRFPGIPSIGCIGMSYQTGVVENGVGVIAFTDGVSAAANVLSMSPTCR